MVENILFYGDCLEILRGAGMDATPYIDSESVDLIYLDPPFNSERVYNVIFSEPDGSGARSQIKGFDDTWTWNDDVAREYVEIKNMGGRLADTIVGLERMLGFCNLFAYLVMMTTRLVELRRVLKQTGSLYLHCDHTAGHYIKVVLDGVFGPNCFKNEIIWHYGLGAANVKDKFRSKHDTIFWYVKSKKYYFSGLRGEPTDAQLKKYCHEDGGGKYMMSYGKKYYFKGGAILDDVWDIPTLSPTSSERLGYPTQKPEALLERIILASSRPGDVVLDPFCGCGTAIAVAEKLGRTWMGIDITAIAINVIKSRLSDSFPDSGYRVIGEPVTTEDAARLAESDDPNARFQFQLWALGLDGARPAGQKLKKGADKGVDGKRYFVSPRGTELIVYSVKSGKVSSRDVRDLARVVERENAAIGVFISLKDITRAMKEEAASAGVYNPMALDGGTYPRVQLLTISEMLAGKSVQWPRFLKDVTYKTAPREKREPATAPKQLRVD